MKKQYLYILLVLASLAIIGCEKNESNSSGGPDFRINLPSSLIVMSADKASESQEQNALSKLDIYIFGENGKLEKIVSDANVSSDKNSVWVDVEVGQEDVKSFYVVANPKNVSLLDDALVGRTTVSEFRASVADNAPNGCVPPLLMTGYVEDVDLAQTRVVDVGMASRVSRFSVDNDKALTGLDVTRIRFTNISSSMSIFANQGQIVNTGPQDVVVDYDVDKEFYYVSISGEANVYIEGLKSGQSTIIPFLTHDIDTNSDATFVIPERGPNVILSNTNPNEYRGAIPKAWEAADYSGITWIDGNRYAVVTDKKDGFYIMELNVTVDGIVPISQGAFYGNAAVSRDCEGVVYNPELGTLFICGEQDQQILEYSLDGIRTGNKLNIPNMFSKANIAENYGFEALGYDHNKGVYWTTTESTLPRDGESASATTQRKYNLHRIQSFGSDLEPKGQYAYKSDNLTATTSASTYAFGVAEITALPDGRLMVLEREFYVQSLSSFVKIKIYLVDTKEAKDVGSVDDLRTLSESDFLSKELLGKINTPIDGIANYEGMCLGPELSDGTHSLILINDSQSRYMMMLSEYIKMIKLSYQ